MSLVSVLNLLYFHISNFRSMCAVPNMAVFCSSLTSWFPGMLLTYFLGVFEIFYYYYYYYTFLSGVIFLSELYNCSYCNKLYCSILHVGLKIFLCT